MGSTPLFITAAAAAAAADDDSSVAAAAVAAAAAAAAANSSHRGVLLFDRHPLDVVPLPRELRPHPEDLAVLGAHLQLHKINN